MNNSTIAWKTRAQLDDFMVKMFHGFPKPQNKFIRDMVYGIQATGDTIITDIARAVAPEDKHRNVENRLSRNLQAEGLHEKIRDAIQADAVRFIDRNTLVIYDPTDVCKPHSYKMEKLSLVRDASRSSKEGRDVLVHGYHGCMAVACQNGKRKTVPLALRLWSSNAPGHKGENDEVLKIITGIMAATGGKGVLVYDRGGDRPAFYGAFIDNSWDFIVRMTGRSVLAWKGMHEIHWLASQCVMRHKHHVEFDSHGKECNIQIEFGAMPVRLPMHPEKELHMVVVKGFGEEPMMLLTSLPVNGSFASMWRIVEGYLTRWRIEETIRFVKQAYGFENVRVHSYRGIRNMASIVLATAYFASVWLGRHVKREVLAEHLANLSQRLKEVPEFANYAIAEGLKRAFTRFGKFCRKILDPEPDPEPAIIYQTLPGFEKFFNPDLC